MIVLFLALWTAYTFYALYRNLRGSGRFSPVAQTMQTFLVCLALYWAWTLEVFTRALWSPLDIGLGLLAGHLLFALSLGITHQHAGDVWRHFTDWRGIVSFAVKSPEIIIRFFGVAAAEELVYRVAAIGMLSALLHHSIPAVIVSALFFCLLHNHFFRKGWGSAFEFLLFALIIGAVYDFTWSLTLVVLIHLVRNVESAYLEYCTLIEEVRDDAEALRILNSRHASLVLETV